MSDNASSDADRARMSQETSMARTKACLSALPPEIEARDDRIAGELARENSSSKAKLLKVYRLLAEFSEAATPFVACKQGCAACCKMNVVISQVEAERLSMVSGQSVAPVRAPTDYPNEKFMGVPCPFLVDESCSVYEARPYACRAHHSFDTSAYWCQPERALSASLTQAKMNGAREAYSAIASKTKLHGFADIRDFFPKQ